MFEAGNFRRGQYLSILSWKLHDLPKPLKLGDVMVQLCPIKEWAVTHLEEFLKNGKIKHMENMLKEKHPFRLNRCNIKQEIKGEIKGETKKEIKALKGETA